MSVLCCLLYYLNFLSPPARYMSVSFYTKMAMIGQRFIKIVKIIQYFIIARFPIVRIGNGSDEL